MTPEEWAILMYKHLDHHFAVAEERDAKQRSQEHASVSEVKDGPRHGLERGLTDEVEGYDIDSTVDHESKDEQADRGDYRPELQRRQ
jgi:hypothetical protein